MKIKKIMSYVRQGQLAGRAGQSGAEQARSGQASFAKPLFESHRHRMCTERNSECKKYDIKLIK